MPMQPKQPMNGQGQGGGMMSQGQQPQQASKPPMKQAPPELQEQYDLLVSNAIKILHTGAREAILKQLQADDPVKAVATVTVMLIERVESAANAKGAKINPSVLINGANEIMGAVIELGTAAKILNMSEEDKVNAVKYAIGLYMKNGVKSGKITPQQLQDAQAAIQKQAGGQPQQPAQQPGQMMAR